MLTSLRRTFLTLSIGVFPLTGFAGSALPPAEDAAQTPSLRAHVSAIQFAGLQPNAAELFTGAGQVSVQGQALLARFGPQPSFTTTEDKGSLVITVSMGANSYGNLLAIPYDITADGFRPGPQHVVVRYCWSTCLVMADTTVRVK